MGEHFEFTRVIREVARVININRQYEDLLQEVLTHGTPKGDRTGVGTRSIFGAHLRFNLQDGFPLITTKFVPLRLIASELLWMLSGSSNIKPLLEQNNHIWDEWADVNGDLGRIYGVQWRRWSGANGERIDQISQVMESLRNNPNSRRHIVSAWNVADLPKMALAPCHAFFQFDVTGGRLSCHLYQRSADMFLGVPFNIASYALLTHMVAQQLDLKVGSFIWSSGDTHIYDNHVKQVREQLSRHPYPFPTLIMPTEKPASIFGYKTEDFKLVDYHHYPAIKGDVAV